MTVGLSGEISSIELMVVPRGASPTWMASAIIVWVDEEMLQYSKRVVWMTTL